ncbi:MAG: PAS domain S-box protein [Comamonadaceae bacterium]|nr:PAS domain S-box protein [Comamonadaceae bacterium]
MSVLIFLRVLLLCVVANLASAQSAPAPVASAGAAPVSITVVSDDNYPPYIFRDDQGELQGILVDIWALWQQHTGIRVKLLATDWAAAQAQMQSGQADVIDTMFKTPARLALYDFSQPYAKLDVLIFFHRSISGITGLESLRGFTVGVKSGDACVEQLRARGVDNLKLYASYAAVVQAAQAGDTHVFCMDQPPGVYLLNQRSIDDDFRHTVPISRGEFHRAVHRGNTAMMATLESGFASITAAQYQQINDKWLGASLQKVGQQSVVRYLSYGVLVVLLLATFLLIWNITLQRRVREKTQVLSDSLAELGQAKQDSEKALTQLKAMLDNDMVGIVRVIDRVIQWANPAFLKMFGYQADEILGKPTLMCYPSLVEYLRLANVAHPLLAAGGMFRDQAEFVRKDGTRFWVELSGATLSHDTGELLWIFMDVTERRKAELARDEALNRLQKLASHLPGMVYQYLLRPDGSSCLPFVSESVRQVYRVSPEQVKDDAAALLEKGHPDDVPGLMASIQESAKHLSLWQHEYRVRFDDGTVHWLFGNAMPERLDDGSVLWHGYVSDITERKAADEQLRIMSRSAEQAPISLVITDLHGNIEYVNPSFTTFTGYSLHEVRGNNPRVLKSGLTPPEVYVDLWQTVTTGGIWHGQFQNRKKDGQIFIEQAVIAPVLDETGRATHYVALKEDVTQRIQSEQALQASLKEKVALLNEVHHRVKNNLQVITSLLRLEAGRSDHAQTRTVLQEMQGRIYAMALLHESLYRSGIFAEVELGAYLRQLATQAFRAQNGQGMAVRLVFDLAPVNIALDKATPCGLLVNELLSNCLKHAFPEGRSGEVLVQSQAADQPGFWRVRVRDTGLGLPPDFESRGKQSLGLQLVSDLARQLGGALETSRQGGTDFSVSFPLV